MPTSLELKYVIVDHCLPIIFLSQHHKDMKAHGEITSAGFFKICRQVLNFGENISVLAYGRSQSLNMGPEPDDAKILEHFLGLS